MNYCEKCYRVFENEKCPNCNTKHVRKVLENDYCYLVEKDTLWAEMLKEILDKKIFLISFLLHMVQDYRLKWEYILKNIIFMYRIYI